MRRYARGALYRSSPSLSNQDNALIHSPFMHVQAMDKKVKAARRAQRLALARLRHHDILTRELKQYTKGEYTHAMRQAVTVITLRMFMGSLNCMELEIEFIYVGRWSHRHHVCEGCV